MSRAVHSLDLVVAEPTVAVGEWGWLLGELGWESDSAGETPASWVHPDGTRLALGCSTNQGDGPQHHKSHLALLTEERGLLDRVRAESSAHGWHERYADRYPHARGEQHVGLHLESSEGFEVEIVWESP